MTSVQMSLNYKTSPSGILAVCWCHVFGGAKKNFESEKWKQEFEKKTKAVYPMLHQVLTIWEPSHAFVHNENYMDIIFKNKTKHLIPCKILDLVSEIRTYRFDHRTLYAHSWELHTGSTSVVVIPALKKTKKQHSLKQHNADFHFI